MHTSCSLRLPAQKQQSPSAQATKALEGFHSQFTSTEEPITHYYQKIDANQAYLTRLTLSSMIPLVQNEEDILSRTDVISRGVPLDSPLIPSEHLCYFTPRVQSSQLGRDGSDASFNPPGGIFTRRMWAGGEMTFEKDNPLSVNDDAWENTFVEGAELKTMKSNGNEMIVVWVRKEIGNDKGVSIVDRRSWIFQPKLSTSKKSKKDVAPPNQVDDVDLEAEDNEEDAGDSTHSKAKQSIPSPPSALIADSSTLLKQNAPNLFRYSALTFNAHAIHLSKLWARNSEGHPNLVVHGPLNLGLLLRKWGKERAGWSIDDQGRFIQGNTERVLHKVAYRAKSPLHVNTPYWIGISSEDQSKVLAVKQDGQIAMEATISTY